MAPARRRTAFAGATGLDSGLFVVPLRASGPDDRAVIADVESCRAWLAILDSLARFALGTGRSGRQLRLCGESSELRSLIELARLAGVCGLVPPGCDGHGRPTHRPNRKQHTSSACRLWRAQRERVLVATTSVSTDGLGPWL
jgi:hypothetical protein